jgi:hypothetical protein
MPGIAAIPGVRGRTHCSCRTGRSRYTHIAAEFCLLAEALRRLRGHRVIAFAAACLPRLAAHDP